MSIKRDWKTAVYIFSIVMLFLSVISGDEPLAIYDVVGLALIFISRYLPGVLNLAVWYIGMAISVITSLLAIIFIIALIGILSFAASHYIIIGVIL